MHTRTLPTVRKRERECERTRTRMHVRMNECICICLSQIHPSIHPYVCICTHTSESASVKAPGLTRDTGAGDHRNPSEPNPSGWRCSSRTCHMPRLSRRACGGVCVCVCVCVCCVCVCVRAACMRRFCSGSHTYVCTRSHTHTYTPTHPYTHTQRSRDAIGHRRGIQAFGRSAPSC